MFCDSTETLTFERIECVSTSSIYIMIPFCIFDSKQHGLDEVASGFDGRLPSELHPVLYRQQSPVIPTGSNPVTLVLLSVALPSTAMCCCSPDYRSYRIQRAPRWQLTPVARRWSPPKSSARQRKIHYIRHKSLSRSSPDENVLSANTDLRLGIGIPVAWSSETVPLCG